MHLHLHAFHVALPVPAIALRSLFPFYFYLYVSVCYYVSHFSCRRLHQSSFFSLAFFDHRSCQLFLEPVFDLRFRCCCNPIRLLVSQLVVLPHFSICLCCLHGHKLQFSDWLSTIRLFLSQPSFPFYFSQPLHMLIETRFFVYLILFFAGIIFKNSLGLHRWQRHIFRFIVVVIRSIKSHHCEFVSVGIEIEVIFFEIDIDASETDFFIVVCCKIRLVRSLFLPAVFLIV
jgi:hypothetical protein